MKIIDEQLEDKQQIVTYKYLSEKLDIHPNKAKQLLKKYVSKLTGDKKYSITIVIGGIFKENDEFCIVLAHDDHVESMRRRFKQISFEHFYSIQPISRFDDINNALYLVDSLLNNHSDLHSSIKKKEKDNNLIHKQCADIPEEIDVTSTREKNPTPTKVVINTNETIVNKKLDKNQKKNTGLDFFTKNKNNNTKPKETEIKVTPKRTNSDFFTQFKKSNSSDNTEAISNNKVSIENVTKKDNTNIDVKPPIEDIQEHSANVGETKNKKKSNKKKENGNKSKNTQKVKRKRIQTFDSSDEEIDSEEEDKKRSELMDVEDEIDFVQPTPPRLTLRENRKKEKQTTTSTFMDNDGFVCTTKEVKIVETICEPAESVENIKTSEPKEMIIEPVNKKIKSCASDTAVQIDKKKTKKSKSSSTQGMKQSSLTSFFKAK